MQINCECKTVSGLSPAEAMRVLRVAHGLDGVVASSLLPSINERGRGFYDVRLQVDPETWETLRDLVHLEDGVA